MINHQHQNLCDLSAAVDKILLLLLFFIFLLNFEDLSAFANIYKTFVKLLATTLTLVNQDYGLDR